MLNGIKGEKPHKIDEKNTHLKNKTEKKRKTKRKRICTLRNPVWLVCFLFRYLKVAQL